MREEATRLFGFLLVGIVIMLGLLAMVHMLSTTALWSSEGAAWVQAIGSILAIWIAIFVADRQHKSAIRLMQSADRLAVRRQLESVLAILDQAAIQVRYVADAIFGEGIYAHYRTNSQPGSIDMDLFLLYQASQRYASKPPFDSLVEVINRIPLHELGSAKMVGAVFQVRDQLLHLGDHLRTISVDPDNPRHIPSVTNGLNVTMMMIGIARTEFRAEMEEMTAVLRDSTLPSAQNPGSYIV